MKNLLKECSDVLTLNITTLAISFTQVEMILKIVLLILSIVYTTDKIIKNRKKKMKKILCNLLYKITFRKICFGYCNCIIK